MEFLVILLAFLTSTVIAFAVTFTIITIYISNHRRAPAKYHFVGTAEVHPRSDMEIYSAKGDTVDNSSAHRQWSSGAGSKEQY